MTRVGGSGGASNCTVNSTTNSTTTPNPASCSGGYAKPTWQTGVSGIPTDSKRDIPDVSFFAGNGFFGSAYLICVSDMGACVTSPTATTEPAGGDRRYLGGNSGDGWCDGAHQSEGRFRPGASEFRSVRIGREAKLLELHHRERDRIQQLLLQRHRHRERSRCRAQQAHPTARSLRPEIRTECLPDLQQEPPMMRPPVSDRSTLPTS